MEIHSLLQPLQGPFHAIGLAGPNEPVTVSSIAKPIFETMQAGANYVASKLTLSKFAKAGILFGAVQALSSVQELMQALSALSLYADLFVINRWGISSCLYSGMRSKLVGINIAACGAFYEV